MHRTESGKGQKSTYTIDYVIVYFQEIFIKYIVLQVMEQMSTTVSN